MKIYSVGVILEENQKKGSVQQKKHLKTGKHFHVACIIELQIKNVLKAINDYFLKL